jgi:hypothetical protein
METLFLMLLISVPLKFQDISDPSSQGTFGGDFTVIFNVTILSGGVEI